MKEMIEAAISIAKIEGTIYALCEEDKILQVFGCRNEKISVFLDEQNSSNHGNVLANKKSKALFSSPQKAKSFQDSPSHRILRHMHEALNIDKSKN